MQKDAPLLPTSAPLASDASLGGSHQASTSGLTNNETGPRSHPKIHRKPSMSKVILGVLANKGKRSRVSQATLKKAVAATGYNMARNTGRFKLALTKLVDKGMLKQVTGKGASGSFRLSRKQASKFKLKAKKRQQRRRKSGQRRPRQRKSLLSSTEGQKQHIKGVRRVAKCRPRQRKSLLSSTEGQKQHIKGVRRVAKCSHN